MKKILSLLLIFILLFLCIGCDQSEKSNESESEKIYENEPYNDVFGTETYTYRSFEDTVESSSQVLKATYLGMTKAYGHYLLDFKVFDSLYDDMHSYLSNKTITVNYPPKNLVFKSADGRSTQATTQTLDIPYEVGAEYLLFLQAYSSVYVEDILYRPKNPSIVIPLDENREPDVASAKMYGDALTDHIENHLLKTSTGDSFTQNALKYKYGYDISYSPSIRKKESFNEVSERSPYVLRVKIEEKNEEADGLFRSLCKCKVIELIKGEVPEEINVYLPSHKVKVGNSYVVSLEKGASQTDPYIITSPYGISNLP